MKSVRLLRLWVVVVLAVVLAVSLVTNATVSAQSGRTPAKKNAEKKTDVEKANEKAQGDKNKPAEQDVQNAPPMPKNQKDEPVIKIATQVVGVQMTVVDKKSGRLVQNLTKKNFTIYEDNVKQEITNFTSGNGPVTVVLVLDNAYNNRYFQGYFNPTTAQEIFGSAAGFLDGFVKPEDFVALVTFSMRPKVIQDFTNDSQKLRSALYSAYRDTLNFSESCIYDALSFTLLGGKAYQLYNENAGEGEYGGLQEVEGHTAVILITLGVDTFSRINYDKALKIASSSGVPIYTIGVGNLIFKKYEHLMSPEQRLTYLQAFNSLNAFATRSGGAYYPMTFESEIPQIMRNIEALLRNQYDVGYVPSNTRREGKERKIKVEVDVDGDGQPDNKQLDIRYRDRYIEADDHPKK